MKPLPAKLITRRAFWLVPAGLAGAAAVVIGRQDRIAALPAAQTDSCGDAQVAIARFDDAGASLGVVQARRDIRSERAWREALTPQQYAVTRQKQTDPPFSGTYYQVHARGIYRCVCCGEALFDADSKYDSGTGWPSFRAPIAAENVRTVPEPGGDLASGIEVICARCCAHLGHIFGDGPRPTHLRYCINESSLHFAAAT